jgi:predicted MPP superfamily phosphohydrolase
MIVSYALGAILLLYFLFVFPTQWLKIERVRYPLGLNIKILQISDLHVEMLRIRPSKLENLIHAENPDFIFLTGDFTRKEKYLKRAEAFLKTIARGGKPTFAVLGNHDHRLKDKRKLLIEILGNLNIPVLRNEVVQSRKNKPILIITHDPNVVTEINRKYSYLMAGHLHGKQFNIPFIFKIKRKGALSSTGIYKGFHQNRNGASASPKESAKWELTPALWFAAKSPFITYSRAGSILAKGGRGHFLHANERKQRITEIDIARGITIMLIDAIDLIQWKREAL